MSDSSLALPFVELGLTDSNRTRRDSGQSAAQLVFAFLLPKAFRAPNEAWKSESIPRSLSTCLKTNNLEVTLETLDTLRIFIVSKPLGISW